MRNVFIITRCLSLECKESSWLVLDSIRIGFPKSIITCIYLGDFDEVKSVIEDKCKLVDVNFVTFETKYKTNNQVIESLVNNEDEDFVVVDSDCVFWSSLEWYNPIQLLAGRHIPEHVENIGSEFVTEERLHTSLLYFSNPQELRKIIEHSFCQFLGGQFTPYNVFNPVVTKRKGVTYFYDTCSILYGAIGGEAFGKDVLDCYDHLYAGSFYNELAKVNPIFKKDAWVGAFSNIESLKGCYKKQRLHWYNAAFRHIEKVYCSKLSEDAIRFLKGFGDYISLIDDLIDEPNNPSLVSKTTVMAGKLFSSNFWTKNSTELRIIEQLVHTVYFSSLEWEKSTDAWKRRDARVLSHCGYYLIIAVFLLETGDVEEAKKFTLEMMEKSHTEHMEDLTMEEQRA